MHTHRRTRHTHTRLLHELVRRQPIQQIAQVAPDVDTGTAVFLLALLEILVGVDQQLIGQQGLESGSVGSVLLQTRMDEIDEVV